MKITLSRLVNHIMPAVLFLLLSCRKEKEKEVGPVSQIFQVNFSSGSIAINSVDSANVIFTQAGGTTVEKHFTRQGGLLTLPVSDMPAGNWDAAISLYTTRTDNLAVILYKTSAAVTMPLTTKFELEAPGTVPGNGWTVETILNDALQILFSPSTIPIEKVDSIKLIFKKPGLATREVKATKEVEKYVVDVHDLSAGSWSAECLTYARTADFTRRLFIDTIQIELPLARGLNVAAPNGKIEDSWEGYILMNAGDDVMVMMAVDNANPFFEVKVKDANKWDYFYQDRYAYNKVGTQNNLTESVSWECQDQCYNVDGNTIRNTTAFAGFSGRVATKPWNNTEIMLLVVGKNPADDLTFYYKYDR